MQRDSAGPISGLPTAGDVVGGKYRVDSVLGVGGMAVVLAATHVHLGEKVALKLVGPTQRLDPESRERFFREAKVASRIRSEHVARVFDLGTSASGVPYIAMEFLGGCDLATRIHQGSVSVDEAASWVMQAAEGVAEAHALGVVHRDLKPANLFLTHRSDGSPCVKVLDFGISKILDGDHAPISEAPAQPWVPEPTSMRSPASISTDTKDEPPPAEARTFDDGRSASLTRSRARIGSPQYMAPEQMRAAREVDARCDVWALGTILYELLAKSPAFDAPTFDMLAEAVSKREPRALEEVRKDVPPGLAAVIARCLRKAPRDRFADVADLASALAPFVPGGGETAARIGRILHRPRSMEPLPPSTEGTGLEHAPTVSVDTHPSRGAFSGTANVARVSPATRVTIGASLALIAATAVTAGVIWSHRGRTSPTAPGPSVTASASAAPVSSVEAPVVPRRPVVAVLAPRDLTGRADFAWVATAAAEMLATDLTSAPGTRIVPPERVARMARDLALDRADVTSPEVLARIHGALGADYVVTGTYAAVGGDRAAKIRFDLAVLDVKDGTARARAGAAGTSSQLFDVIDRASTDLRVAMGGAQPTAQQVGEARAASPSSPEAMRLYAEGIALLRLGKAVDALPLLEQASRLAPDSPFVAWQHGLALRHLGRDNDSVPVLKKAFDLRGPLSREDQLRIEAAYREAMHDQAASAECFRTLFGFFPDSVDYALSYARALANAGRPNEAWGPLEALRRLPPPDSEDVRIELQSSANAGREGDIVKRESFARAALAKAGAIGLSSILIEAHMQLAQTLQYKGSIDASLPEYEQARDLAAKLGDKGLEAGALTAIADVYQAKGDFARAYPLYDDALAKTRALGDLYRIAGILNTRAMAKYTQGDLEGSRVDWLEAGRQYEAIGDREGVGHTTGNVALAYQDQGDLPRAQATHEKAIGILKEIGNRSGVCEELCNLVELSIQRGALTAAEKWQTELEATAPLLKRQLIGGATRELRGMIARQTDDLAAAQAGAEEARTTFSTMGAQPFTTDDELLLAELALDRGDAAKAEAGARACADWYEKNAIVGSVPVAHALIARALAAQSAKGAEALAASDRAMAAAARTARVVSKLEAERARGVALAANGQVDAAVAALESAVIEARSKGFVWQELELRLARVKVRGNATERGALASDARAKGFARIARLATE